MQIDGLGAIPACVVEFFGTFSRFEFALLAAGYIGGEIGQNAWANWDGFAADLHKSFFPRVAGDAATGLLFQEPPRKLVKRTDEDCEFIDSPVPTDGTTLLLLVRTIRNNLFHGSKVYFRPRDEQLVNAGIKVLKHALEAASLMPRTNRVSSAYGYADLGSP